MLSLSKYKANSSVIISLTVILLIPLIVVFIWFHDGLISSGSEEGINLYNPVRMLNLSTSTWFDISTGLPNINILPEATFFSASFLLQRMAIPAFLFQAITYFLLMATGMIAVFFILFNVFRKHGGKTMIAFIGAVFYLLNPFSMTQVWSRGIYANYISFALFPLTILLVLLGLSYQKYKFSFYIVFASILFSSAFSLVTAVVDYWFLIVLFIISHFFINWNNKKIRFFDTTFFFLIFILWIFAHAWWLLPILISGREIFSEGFGSAVTDNLSSLKSVSFHFPLTSVIRLIQNYYFFASGTFGSIYSSSMFQVISWIPVLVLFIGIKKAVRFKDHLPFTGLFLIGIFICLGSNLPTGPLFIQLFKSIPYMQMFRNPYEKFGLVFLLGYTFFFSLGLFLFSDFITRKFKSTRLFKSLLIGILLILVCGIYLWPIWTGRLVVKTKISVPNYYHELDSWLGKKDIGGNRIFAMPFVGGEGIVQKWDNTTYSGFDSFSYLINKAVIGNSLIFPLDLFAGISKYMSSVNIAPTLSLLRVQYVVNRRDIVTSEKNSEQIKYLTSSIYPPLDVQKEVNPICTNIPAQPSDREALFIGCKLEPNQTDWRNIKYIHFSVKTDAPSVIEVAIRDENGARPRWSGKNDPEYTTAGGEWYEFTIPTGWSATEYPQNIDFSKIKSIEIFAYPKSSSSPSVKEFSLAGIWLDAGVEKPLAEFRLAESFGNIDIYKSTQFNPAPEYGLISNVYQVDNILGLLEEAEKKRQVLDKFGLIVRSQNPNKDLTSLPEFGSDLKIAEKKKVSSTKYWISLDETSARDNKRLIILSQSFNKQWKVIPGIKENELDGGFFNNIKILRSKSIPESNHFLVNGYANLWSVDPLDDQYVIVFLPQIIAEIGWKVTKTAIILIIVLSILEQLKNLLLSRRF